MPLRDIQPWNWWFLRSKICLFTQEATTPLPHLICKLQFSALRIHFASQKHISSTNGKSNKEISIALPQNCTRLITTWLPSLQKMYFYCFVIFSIFYLQVQLFSPFGASARCQRRCYQSSQDYLARRLTRRVQVVGAIYLYCKVFDINQYDDRTIREWI